MTKYQMVIRAFFLGEGICVHKVSLVRLS